ncbi:uncharacterized protein [Panulirus ornatus]|uniref:uncharacterized protein isoform X1 n=2 Tax=Panulirus ornatus TaxID=150431 RepID=UPI003A87CFCD
MKVLVVLVMAAVVVNGLPRKTTNSFPKKFDATLDGKKSSYSGYSIKPGKDVVVPAGDPYFQTLTAPSSYATFFEQQPQVPLLPPEPSGYAVVPEASQGSVPLTPPLLDSYSGYAVAGVIDMVPPPLSAPTATEQQKSSYLSYEDAPEESLKPPAAPSDAPVTTTSTEVLASLVAMARIPPPTSSYSEYLPTDTSRFEEDAPSLYLRPPSA